VPTFGFVRMRKVSQGVVVLCCGVHSGEGVFLVFFDRRFVSYVGGGGGKSKGLMDERENTVLNLHDLFFFVGIIARSVISSSLYRPLFFFLLPPPPPELYLFMHRGKAAGLCILEIFKGSCAELRGRGGEG